jgi:PAS domain S-box-containing protein
MMDRDTPEPTEHERTLRAAEAITQIGRVLVHAPSLKDASRQIARSVRTLLGARVVGICYLRTDSGEHVAVAVAGEVGPTLTARPIFSHGESTLGLAVHEGRPIVTTDILNDPGIPISPGMRDALAAAECRALLTLPLHIGDRVVGTLTVCDVAGRVYNDEDLRLAQAFADLAALVLENARLLGESERQRAAAENLAAVGGALALSLDMDEVAQQIADSVRALLGTEIAAVYRLEPESGSLTIVAISGETGGVFEKGMVCPPGVGFLGLATRERQPVATPDCLADPRVVYPPEILARLERTPFRALLALPLVAQERLVGALAIGARRGRVFTDEEIRLTEAFASQVATALEKARVFAESERRRAAAEELIGIGRFLSQSLDPTEVARRIAESLRTLLRADAAQVYRAEPHSAGLVMLAFSGEPSELRAADALFPPGVGVMGLAVGERRPVSTPNYLNDPRVAYTPELRARVATSSYLAVLAVPLMIEGRVVGAFAIRAREGRVFRDEEIRLAEAFAGQAAVALENAGLHAETEQRRREAEAIADLARTINATLDLDKILERVAEAATRLTGCDTSWVLLRDAPSETMAPRAWAGVWSDKLAALHVEPGRGLGGQVILTGRAMRTDDYAADPRITRDFVEAVTEAGPVSVMVAPIRAGDRVEGLLYALNRPARPFCDRDEAFLQRLADQAAVAVRNAQLFAREQAARLEAEVSEQRFRTLVQSLGAVVWEAAVPDLATLAHESPRRFTFVSQRVESLLGYPVERWLTEPGLWDRVLHPDDRDRVLAACRAAAAAGTDGEMEYRAITADGRVVWLHDFVRVIRDADGRVRLRRGVIVDVTARKQDDRRHAAQSVVAGVLAESPSLDEAIPQLLKALCEGVGWDVGEYWRADQAAGLLRWGGIWHAPWVGVDVLEALSRRTTFAPGVGLPGRAWAGREPIWVDDVIEAPWFLRGSAATASGLHNAVAIPIVNGRGVTGVLVFFGREVRTPDSALFGFMGEIGAQIGQFVERKRLEDERARLFSAVEQAGESIIVTDPDGAIVYVNPAFERATGYTSAEAVGRTPRLLKSERLPREFYEELWRTILGGQVWHGEIVNRRKDGTLYTERQSITPVRDERGRITRFVSIGQDVTQSKELEAQLRQSTKMEAVGRLAGGVAHDFNNLLTLILSYSELLVQGLPEGSPLRRQAEAIETASERAAALTRQLLIFSRKQVVNPRVLDVNLVVSNLGKMIERLIGEDIDLRVRLVPEPALVKADPGQLDQVIMNLAVNARDAMPRGGRLTIETATVELDNEYASRHIGTTPGRHVMLAVADTGVGMDAETLSHIFEPFFTTKGPGQGSGLGLSTVFGIVKQSGGDIEVQSESGMGTTFRIYLPRVEAPPEGHAAAAPSAPAPVGSETVLLVEDDAGVRELAAEILTHKGYRVLEACDGAEALGVVERHSGPIHLLLTDVVMPGLTGPELAAQVRTLRPRIRVLYISGYTASAHEILQASGSALLEKPFSPDGLARKVREVLDREPEA